MNVSDIPESSLLRQRAFVIFCIARLSATVGYQMLAVTAAWQIYEVTNSAFDLGLVGLIQFAPSVILFLLIGHTADRYDRRLIICAAQGIYVLAAAIFTAAFITLTLSRNMLFVVMFMIGFAQAFEKPTAYTVAPALVPTSMIARAVAAWTSVNKIALIAGPAVGGLIYAINPFLVGVFCIASFVISVTLVSFVHLEGPSPSRDSPTLTSALAGFEFLRSKSRLLGVITLDLFVVLLGGATALLPIFARDILEVGPLGLGILRSAAAAGALAMALILARYPIERSIGYKMFAAVAAFGIFTIVFGLSTSFTISLMMLAALGAVDAISVVIRHSLVQIETPDEKRGRVSAINLLLVGSSNTLGEFESGLIANWIGVIPSVVIGGVGSLLIAFIWMALFPDLWRIDRFEPADESGRNKLRQKMVAVPSKT
jgi:MFS family permease